MNTFAPSRTFSQRGAFGGIPLLPFLHGLDPVETVARSDLETEVSLISVLAEHDRSQHAERQARDGR